MEGERKEGGGRQGEYHKYSRREKSEGLEH